MIDSVKTATTRLRRRKKLISKRPLYGRLIQTQRRNKKEEKKTVSDSSLVRIHLLCIQSCVVHSVCVSLFPSTSSLCAFIRSRAYTLSDRLMHINVLKPARNEAKNSNEHKKRFGLLKQQFFSSFLSARVQSAGRSSTARGRAICSADFV